MRRFTLTIILLQLFFGLAYSQTGVFFSSERFSSALINDLCQDKYGYMWIATDYGLNRFDGYHFTEYLHQHNDSTTISSSTVCTLFCDKDGELWVGTNKGLDRFDYATGTFIHYPFARGRKPRVTKMTHLSDGRMIVATSGYHGLYCMTNEMADDYTEGDLDMLFVNSIKEDDFGRIWQCSFSDQISMKDANGIHKMRTNQGFVVDFVDHDGDFLIVCMHGLHSYRDGQLTIPDYDMSALEPSAIIRCVFTDSKGNTYIGTRGDGLYCIPANSRKLERVPAIASGLNLRTTKIWAITEDRQHNIWLGCQSKGLVMLPAKSPQFSSWSFATQGIDLASTITAVCEGDNGYIWCSVQGNGIYGFDADGHLKAHPTAPDKAECIFRDRRGNYWVGTDDALYAYDPLTGVSTRKATIDCDKFNSITDDAHGRLYISTFSRGLCVYDTNTGDLRQYSHKSSGLCNDWIMGVTSDKSGNIWLATASGVSCYNPKTENFDRPHLFDVMCFNVLQTRSGATYVGTEQGIYRLEGEKRPELVALGQLSVGYMIEDEQGFIWCSTSKGIWQYDPATGKTIGHVYGNGLSAKEYITSVGLLTSDNKICYANYNGLTVFRSKDVIGCHTTLNELYLTAFRLPDRMIYTQDDDHYEVSYLDNAITLEFSLLDYNAPENIIFEYRINQSAWLQNPEGENTILLNHLQPGTYTIEVRAMSGTACSQTKTITLTVTPPWYRSKWAHALYFIALIGIVIGIGFSYRRRAHRLLAEEKMRFLINATHDIRSPLTIIMGAIGKLKDSKMAELKSEEDFQSFNSSTLQPSIETIDRNAQRLLQLVNQILDQRRLDKKQMQLHCQETNMVDFISGVCKLYQFSADQRNISFTFEHERDHVLAWIDRINFDKVISNLLSNAFKYTYDNGEVKVVLHETEKSIELSVIDNGMGFKDEDPNRFFDRFYQGQNSANLGIQGTGIGLNLCRAITEMHGGEIKALRREDKQGACFVVTIPKGNKHLRPEQIVTDSPVREVLSSGIKGKKSFRQFRILIVDDEPEIARYIISELGDRYKFDHAINGKEALKMLLTDEYDLVISDMMMPEMDGLTLLKHIKDNTNISQIPVIMLTSKAEVEYKLEGLRGGADAYIAKPFDMEELHIQIDNLIDNVRRLKGKFSGALKQEDRIEQVEVKGNDDALMERIMRSVNANFSDPDYNVDIMANDVGISRAQLHRKMKEITGVSTGKFLRNLRMEQAARLLREGKINISQIADHVGYADQAHFSTAFKTHFGQSPSEYAETHKE
ncbi:MAG: response regulator [Prevotella sp.]|nr:response regulator [Prevotella sp.]